MPYLPAPDPLKIENPQFTCSAPNEYALEASVAISDPSSGDKFARYSTLTFRTDQMSGYPMDIAVRYQDNEKEWHTGEGLGEITIRFRGDYEASTLREFLQHTGLMATVAYGPVAQYNNGEEEE
jgi:hypothetical protein